jgi:hypothetical protein
MLEIEVVGPVHAEFLVVASPCETEMNRRATGEELDRKKEASTELGAVRSDGIDLLRRVPPVNEAGARSAARAASDRDDIVRANCPFALDPHEPRPQVEDEVVPLVGERLKHADSGLDRRMDDRGLGDRAFLVRREHETDATRGIGWAVS